MKREPSFGKNKEKDVGNENLDEIHSLKEVIFL